jgi:hypothetical protein
MPSRMMPGLGQSLILEGIRAFGPPIGFLCDLQSQAEPRPGGESSVSAMAFVCKKNQIPIADISIDTLMILSIVL